MKTKILAFLGTTFVILAFSGCDFFNSKEGQTSVISFPAGTTESYTIKTDFPAGSTGQLVTINHQDNRGGADGLVISYKVTDVNADNILDTKDCAGFVLNFNAIPITTKWTGIDAAVNDTRVIWFGGDATGTCTNTAFTLQDGGPKALALSDKQINHIVNPDHPDLPGIPGFIKYGTKAAPVTQYNITGLSTEVKFISTYGQCSNGNVWNDATKACEAPAPTQPNDPNPGQVLNQNISCYHKVTSGNYTGQNVKCGDNGCVYPDNSYCRDTGCYLNNGTPQWDSTINWDTITEFNICRDAAGNPTDGTGGTEVEWVQHTWRFLDGVENSYILNRSDAEYQDFIRQIENLCVGVKKAEFQWMPDAGNDSNWREFGIPKCGGVELPPDVGSGGGMECYDEDNGNEICTVCEDPYSNYESRDCRPKDDNYNNDWQNQIADSNDLARQKKDMENQLKDHKRNNLRELDRMVKDLQRSKKDLEKKIERYEKLLKRIAGAGTAKQTAENTLKWLKSRFNEISGTESDAANIKKTCEDNLEKASAAVNALAPGKSKNSKTDKAWSTIRRYTEPCWMLRGGVEFPLRVVEQENEQADLLFELSKAIEEMDRFDIDIPAFVTDFIKDLETRRGKWMPIALECKKEVQTLGQTVFNSTTNETIDDALQELRDAEQDCNWDRQDMQYEIDEWRSNEPWKVNERAWRVMEDQRHMEGERGEFEQIRRDLDILKDLPGQVRTDDEFVKKHLANIEKLRQEAIPIVDKFLAVLDNGGEPDWQKLEQLSMVFDQSAGVIREYCEREYQNCSLSEEIRRILYDTGDKGPGYVDDFSRFEDELVQRIVQRLEAFEKELQKSLEHVIKNFEKLFNERIAEQLISFSERNDTVGDGIKVIFNNADFLGEDKMKTVAENRVELYEVLDKFDGYDDLDSEVEAIVLEWKAPVNMPSASLKSEIVSKFEELLKTVSEDKDTSAIVSWLNDKLAENRRKLAVEDDTQFIDASLEEWHGGYFIASSFEGDRDQSGSRTGYVRPGDLINRCEALKVAIESSGIEKVPGVSDWWCSTYIETGKQNGIEMASSGDYSGNPSRAEMAQLWVEIGNFERTKYNGEFPDVRHTDWFVDFIATVNKLGIMTGQGDGRFDPHGLTNRAEVAAMEVRFSEAIAPDQFFNDLEAIDIDDFPLIVDPQGFKSDEFEFESEPTI